MQKIIINGANGFVASHFILELLQHNYEVIAFVRKGEKYSAQQRMEDVLNEIDPNIKTDYSHLKVYDYSLFEANYSLTKEQIEVIFDGKVQFFHFAASLKFSAKDKEKIFETNIGGLENSIRFFQKNATPDSRFIFISTAYSCGKYTGSFREKFYPNEDKSQFRNYYEQSKRVAENVMKEQIDRDKINGHVIRLSQVVGDSKTGVTKTGYGIFDLAKRLHGIAVKYPDRTLRLKVDPEGTQNFIPIDRVVEALIKMMKVSDLPQVVNLTAKTDVKNETIAHCINKQLPVTVALDKNLKKKEMNSLERMIAVGMSFTGKYACINLRFARRNLDKIIHSDNNGITKRSLCRMMESFIHDLQENKTSAKV